MSVSRLFLICLLRGTGARGKMGQLVRISAKRGGGLQGAQMVDERRRSQILNLFRAGNDGLYMVCEKKKWEKNANV